MVKEALGTQGKELRSEVRHAASEGASIEFKPFGCTMTYHFPLRDISENGLGLLVNKASDIFRYIHVGDVYDMKFHKGNASPDPDHLRVEIRHISEPAGGKPRGHFIIGLHILGKMTGEDLLCSGC